MKSGPDFEAVVTLVSSEKGGRTDSVVSGYRPQHALAEDWVTSGAHLYLCVDQVNPGESALANISLLSPLEQSIWIGREIRIQEADKIVGYAKVTKIFNAALIKHS